MKKRNLIHIYQFATVIIVAIIIGLFSAIFDWNIKWYILIIAVFISSYFGKFFYVIFSGLTVSNVQFIDSPNINSQQFIVDFQLGISNKYNLSGEFNNSINLSEVEISNILYTQTTRKMLNPLIAENKPVTINFTYNGQILPIYFYELT